MRNAILFILFVITLSSFDVYAQIYNNCCFCIKGDDTFLKAGFINAECRSWFRKADKKYQCDHKEVFKLNDFINLKTPSASCSKINVWGAFHGTSSDFTKPFTISRVLAKSYNASSVCYDGSSCLIFNNISDTKMAAMKLNLHNTKTHFEITGNQNLGFCAYKAGQGVVEIEEFSSKLSLHLRAGQVKVQYEECSKDGDRCARVEKDNNFSNDPNSKNCIFQGATVQQKCCPYSRLGVSKSKWGEPGKGCEE